MTDYVDQTPPDVLTELGRLTLAAIYLEDWTRTFVWMLKPKPGGAVDTSAIGPRIDEGIKALDQRLTDPLLIDDARRWLGEAKAALQQRNAVLHSIPVTFEPLAGTTPVDGTFGQFLHHIPNSKDRPQVATPLTVEGLRLVTDRLLRARREWRDLSLRLFQHLDEQQPQPSKD